ncbi:winged helix-turn-helix transcriptional regulator [Halosimplex aquaticum]|uniref:Winged helix-turn-helix transcriptional regulator n=1 Tax=Halosimplex aquaticum TaxID=3026162 RepID=A0ABD5Y5Q1_9EURY|nr:winged helix-turn-helix transcriptional regulator [Halosimplex aquaticum]
MVKAISGYLDRSGSIGILVNLKNDSKRFNELKELVGVSPSTLTKRLDEGQELGVITTRLGKDEYERDQRAVHHEYMITERGLVVLDQIEKFDIMYRYRQLREAEQQLDEGLDEMHEWIEDNSDQLARAEDVNPTRKASGEDITDSSESERDYSEHMEKGSDHENDSKR